MDKDKSLIKVEIVFYGDENLVKSLYNSYHPDNIVVPKYMSIKEDLRRKEYLITFYGVLMSRVVDAIKQSVDEILALATMIKKSLSRVSSE